MFTFDAVGTTSVANQPGFHPSSSSTATLPSPLEGTWPKLGDQDERNMLTEFAGKKDNKNALKPWAEKHRPKTLSDVCQSPAIKRLFEQALSSSNSNIPHFLFSGPPGTGKTTTAWALLYELFGRKAAARHVFAMNSSDDRGVDVVRNEIKPFCARPVDQSQDEPDRYPSPNLKFMILDEFDAMTFEAQTALRRVIEENTDNTRFILCCNYVNKVIDPIQSRCSGIIFHPLGTEAHFKHLRMICEQEDVTIDDETLHSFVRASKGDCRRSITMLQAASAGFYPNSVDGRLFLQMSGMLSHDEIERTKNLIFQDCATTTPNSDLPDLDQLVEQQLQDALDPVSLLRPLLESFMQDGRATDYQRAKFGLVFAEINGLLAEGVPIDCVLPQLYWSLCGVVRGPSSAEEQTERDRESREYGVRGDPVEARVKDEVVAKQKEWGHVVW